MFLRRKGRHTCVRCVGGCGWGWRLETGLWVVGTRIWEPSDNQARTRPCYSPLNPAIGALKNYKLLNWNFRLQAPTTWKQDTNADTLRCLLFVALLFWAQFWPGARGNILLVPFAFYSIFLAFRWQHFAVANQQMNCRNMLQEYIAYSTMGNSHFHYPWALCNSKL